MLMFSSFRRTAVRFVVRAICLIAAVGGPTAEPATAWRSTGHMIVAQIAYDELSEPARLEADRLSALLADREPSLATFVAASTWLDGLRAQQVPLFDRWHYVNLPYNADGLPTVSGAGSGHLLEGLHDALAVLASPAADDQWRAFALRVVSHLVAEAHQPLHCVARYTHEHPSGDRGGNDFPIASDDPAAANLHLLWDGTFGLFPEVALDRVDSPEVAEEVARWAGRVTATVEPEARPTLEPTVWTRESFDLAREVVYRGIEPGAEPSVEYLETARGVVLRRLRLAGQRLGAVLEPLLAPGPPSSTD